MSQEAVEKLLGRMITDRQFRCLAVDSLEASSRMAGYSLSSAELLLLSGSLDLHHITELGDRLDPGLRRT
jgi:hypothetical protein